MRLDSFFPLILVEAIGAPDPLVNSLLAIVSNEFCRETLSWTENQEITLLSEVTDFEIDVPSQSYLLTVRDVFSSGRRLQAKTMAQLQTVLPDWQTSTSSEPVYYNQANERGLIQVFPTPNVQSQITVRAAYAPLPTATSLPDFLYQHMDVIASGVKSRLLLMPVVSWSNPNLGGYYKQKFDEGVLRVRIEEMHDRVPGSLRVTPRQFGF